jgi:L-asparagine transporter-like permease
MTENTKDKFANAWISILFILVLMTISKLLCLAAEHKILHYVFIGFIIFILTGFSIKQLKKSDER